MSALFTMPVGAMAVAGFAEVQGVRHGLAEWDISLDHTQPGNSCRVRVARHGVLFPPGTKIRVLMGYANMGVWPVFTGYVSHDDNHDVGWVTAADGTKWLKDARITAFYLAQPKAGELVQDALAAAEAAALKAQGVPVTLPRDVALADTQLTEMFTAEGIDGVEFLQRVQRAYYIPFGPYWDADGQFIWREPQSVAANLPLLAYGKSVETVRVGTAKLPDDPLALEALTSGAADLAAKNGYSAAANALAAFGVYQAEHEIETFPMPWLRAGEAVAVTHPRINEGTQTVLRIRSVRHTRSAGRTRTAVTVRDVL